MEWKDYFPVWNKLTAAQQQKIMRSTAERTVSKGTVIHNGELDCTGLLLVQSGQLRAYILSPEGREITLYRLFPRDICLFSASCIMNSIQFDITIAAQKDTEFCVVAPDVYKELMQESVQLSNYTNEVMASRFSEVMWLIEQIMWKILDARLAAFLLEESTLEGNRRLQITHEAIANHLGTHREVITRMLRYFQNEGLVSLSRGAVEIADEEALAAIGDR